MSHDFINCKGTSHGKTVTKGNLLRQALISVYAETSDHHSEPFGSLRACPELVGGIK
jgi:hypothetical protein